MSTIHLKVITPKRIVHEEDVQSVTAPTSEGEITILPHHENLFAMLKEGIVTARKDKNEEYFAIGGGYIETDGNTLNILVSRAYGQHEIDEELTKKAIEEAERLIRETKDPIAREQAQLTLRNSIIDMKLVKRRRNRQP